MTFDLKLFIHKLILFCSKGYMNAVGRPVIEAALLKPQLLRLIDIIMIRQ